MWSTPELPDPSLRRERQQLSQQQQPHGIGAAAEGSTARMMVLPLQTAAAGHGDGDYAHEIAETLRFQEEIQSLMRETLLESQVVHGPVATGVLPTPQPPTSSSSPSFTALLGLPTSQAMELLHDPGVPPHTTAATLPPPLTAVDFPYPGISPTFPSNAALVERAARYSVFAASEAAAAGNAEGSPDSSSLQPSNSSDSARAVKPEPADSDSRSEQQQMALSPSPPPLPHQRGGKRKEPEKNKGKPGNGGKKNKGAGEDGATKVEAEDKQQLPYVHVRARRGQATDSHSLAERARREKINARMKLLQELVPGCSKISGTALVLDEIINHVQCLQRQVELLSMRLAAVNPRIDFGGLDSFLTTEPVRVPGSAVGMDAAAAAAPPVLWAEVPVDDLSNRLRHHHNQQNQIWQGDSAGPHPSPSVLWSGDSGHHQLYLHHHHHHGGLIGPGTSLFGYDSASVVPLHASQLKTEL